MRTPEQKLATKLRKMEEREAHRERVFKQHPSQVRYAKAAFKKAASVKRKHASQLNLACNNNEGLQMKPRRRLLVRPLRSFISFVKQHGGGDNTLNMGMRLAVANTLQ
jgi:hypothetical protein